MTTFCQCEMCNKMGEKHKHTSVTQMVEIDPKNCTYYLELENGKYTVYIEKDTNDFKALRHGEPWRDLCGDNLIFFLMVELIESNEENKCLQDKIKDLEHELTLDEWERK